MRVQFNPTGTQVRKGLLVARLDLYSDIGTPLYDRHHVYVPVIPEGGYTGKVIDGVPLDQKAYDSWLAKLPHVWQLNPCLCHFITIPELTKLEDIENYSHAVFGKDTLATLNDILVLPKPAHLISPLMRNRGKFSDKQPITIDSVDLVSSINDKFASIVVPLEDDGKAYTVEPQSIDVGASAIDRDAYYGKGQTYIGTANPANATGTLDTIEIWAHLNLTLCEAITAFWISNVSGSEDIYETRDEHAIGSVTAGSAQEFSGIANFDVETDDCIGMYFTVGYIQVDPYGDGAGRWYYEAGDQTAAENQATYWWSGARDGSIYGTGSEAGEARHLIIPEIIGKDLIGETLIKGGANEQVR